MESIFKWFTLTEDASTVVKITWFASTFDVEEFEGIDKLFTLYLHYCRDLGVVAKRNYFEAFITTEGRKVVKKHHIRLETMEKIDYADPGSFNEAFHVISSTAMQMYDRYMTQDLTDRTFKVDMRAFMEVRKRERTQKVMADAFPLLVGGSDVDEINESLQRKLSKIASTYDVKLLNKLDFLNGKKCVDSNGNVSKSSGIQRFLFKTGLPCVDGDTGGVFSKQLIALASLPGAGKTRLAVAHYAYQAAVVYKLGVLFKELELSKEEVENMFISLHLVNMFGGSVKIEDKYINRDELTDEQRRYVEAARMDLFESEGKYGRIVIDTDPLIVESFRQETGTYLKLNPDIQAMVIDYAGIAQSKPEYGRPPQKYEIITTLYEEGKELVKEADIAGIIINQFTDEGNKAARAGKTIEEGHIMGGQVIARHADYGLAMTCTDQQKIAGIRVFSTFKVRAATGFQNVPARTDLGILQFQQVQMSATN